MAKAYSPDELVTRLFTISLVGVGLFIAVVFIFLL